MVCVCVCGGGECGGVCVCVCGWGGVCGVGVVGIQYIVHNIIKMLLKQLIIIKGW